MSNTTNALIIGAVVAAVGAGGYYAMRGGDGAAPATPTSAKPSVLEKVVSVATQEPAVSGLLGAARKDTIVAISISPKNLTPVVDWFNGIHARFAALGVWKRHNLDEELSRSFLEGLNKNPDGADVVQQTWAFLQSAWRDVTEAGILISDKGFTPIEQLRVPSALVAIRFNDETKAKSFLETMAAKALAGEPEMKTENLSVVRRAAPATGFDISIKSNENNRAVEVKGLFDVQGDTVRLLIGDTDLSSYVSEASGERLTSTEGWTRTSAAYQGEAALTMHINTPLYLSAIERVVDGAAKLDESVTPEKIAEVKEALSYGMGQDVGSSTMSLGFDGGISTKTCGVMSTGSEMGKLYEAMFARRKDAGDNPFYKLIDENTIAAGQIQLDLLRIMVAMFKQMRTRMPAEGAAEPGFQQFDAVLRQVEAIDAQFGFSTFGLVVNTPIGGPIPGVGLYIGGSRLTGDDLVTQFAQQLSQVMQGVPAAGGEKPEPRVVDAPGGGKRIEIPIQGAMTVIIAPVASNALLATIDPGLVDASKTRLAASKGYLDSFDLKKLEVDDGVYRGDALWYANTDGLIAMGKPYLPLLLAQQKGDKRIELSEAEEVMNQLRVSVLSAQASARDSAGVVCSNARITTLN